MVRALFDTNILVDYLNAVPQARTELHRYAEKAVSIITWMEVMVGASRDVEAVTRSFLNGFDIIALDGEIPSAPLAYAEATTSNCLMRLSGQRRRSARCFW
jgi:predicted nucleic acid-binding protein